MKASMDTPPTVDINSKGTPSIMSPRRRTSISMRRSVRMLLHEGQNHLFDHWPSSGENDDDKLRFSDQVEKLDASYPGGLVAYLRRAKKFLADQKGETHNFDGYTPSGPEGEWLKYGSEHFVKSEEAGVKEARRAAFVLVAGGLGERLGYSGVKLGLPVESTTGICFLELYIENILALQKATTEGSRSYGSTIPLVIMTSDHTHKRIEELLSNNNHFGVLPDQIQLLKQEESVPCVSSITGNLLLDPCDPYRIQTMPRGNGDVHRLLFNSGLLQKWQEEGRHWVVIFEEANGLTFKALPALLGASVLNDWDVNLLACPRKGKSATAGIIRLTDENGSTMVTNVDNMHAALCSMGYASLDLNDLITEHSPFPAPMDQMVLKLTSYLEELSRTKGDIACNVITPLFEDEAETKKKKPWRMECSMQQYTRTLSSSSKVGVTVSNEFLKGQVSGVMTAWKILDAWLINAPVRNSAELAAMMPLNAQYSPASSEMAIYKANCLILRRAGVEIEEGFNEIFNDQILEVWPHVLWIPRWAITFSDVQKKVGSAYKSSFISKKSTLLLHGEDIEIDNIHLEGTLVIHAIHGALVRLSDLRVRNKGWRFLPTHQDDQTVLEVTRMRGFQIEKLEQHLLEFDKDGPCSLQNVTLTLADVDTKDQCAPK